MPNQQPSALAWWSVMLAAGLQGFDEVNHKLWQYMNDSSKEQLLNMGFKDRERFARDNFLFAEKSRLRTKDFRSTRKYIYIYVDSYYHPYIYSYTYLLTYINNTTCLHVAQAI